MRSREFGGLASPMPVYAASFLFIVLASVGLPLLNGFVGEFLVLSGAFQAKPIYGILAATGVIWSAVYLLWMYQRVFYGKVTHPVNNSLRDLLGFEKGAVWPCAVAALVMGVAPILWLGAIDPAVQAALTPFAQVVEQGGGPMTQLACSALSQTIPQGVDYVRILPETHSVCIRHRGDAARSAGR